MKAEVQKKSKNNQIPLMRISCFIFEVIVLSVISETEISLTQFEERTPWRWLDSIAKNVLSVQSNCESLNMQVTGFSSMNAVGR